MSLRSRLCSPTLVGVPGGYRSGVAASGAIAALVVALLAAVWIGQGATRSLDPSADGARMPVSLPADFVENRGQYASSALFVARRGELSLAVERGGLRIAGPSGRGLALSFAGSSAATVTPEARRPGEYNFVFGDDPSRWQSGVPSFGAVRYDGLYPGIDVRVRQGDGTLEYDALVAPGADPDRIVIRVDGVRSLRLTPGGDLLIAGPSGMLRQSRPRSWQILPGGVRRAVASRFRLMDASSYGFAVSGHDPSFPLVIDPGIDWSTFLGGSGDETLGSMVRTTDGTGDLVIGGHTRSPEFPASGGIRASGTPFVARLSADGSALRYATFFGGANVHTVMDVAVDPAGNPLVVGETNSKDFPTTTGAFDRSPPGNPANPFDFGDYDGYVIRFDANGGGPIFGTYLAGDPVTGQDIVARAGYDPAGNPIVAGTTAGTGFPTTAGAFDRTIGGKDAFVSRFSPDGTQLTYSTFFGGDSIEDVFDMAVGSDGAVNITGHSWAPDPGGAPMPLTADAFDRTNPLPGSGTGWRDGFFARLRLNGAGASDLEYSTFMGGDQHIEAGNGIALDPADPTLVTLSGFTRSGDFPTTPGALQRLHFAPVDATMGWVARFRVPVGGPGSLLWSTLFGGPGNTNANDVVVDSGGAAIIVGGTAVEDPPTTDRAYDRIPGSGVGYQSIADGYVARISSNGGTLLYGTALGASFGEVALEVVHAGGNSVVVAGITNSIDFPVTPGAFDTVYAGDGKPSDGDSPGTLAEDIFVTRLTLDPQASLDATPPPAPAISWPAEGMTLTATPSTGVSIAYDWSDVGDASGIAAYHLQVSPNPEFRHDFQAELDDWYEAWSPTSLDMEFLCCGQTRTFSMRVQTLDGVGNLGPWSPVRTFNLVQATTTALTAPTLTSPANGGRHAPGSITFAWNHVAGATSYTLEVDTTSSFNSTNKITASNLTTNRRVATLSGERKWSWRVRAFSGATAGPWSSVRSLETKNGSPAAPIPPPGTPLPPPPSSGTGLKSLVMSPEIATGGASSTGTVTLHQAAPAGGAMVTLASQYPERVGVPPSVVVPAGSTSAAFTATSVDARTVVSSAIVGSYGGASQAWWLAVVPSEPTLELGPFSLSAPTVQGGGTVQATVATTGAGGGFIAGPGGAIVHLGSTNPAVASVPPSVTIPQGASSTTFTVTTHPVTTSTPVTIVATRSSMKTQALEVLPPGTLSALAFSPNPAIGSGGSTGTVTLGGAAPDGGKVVTLSSSNTTWVRVPVSVTVPAGATSATFTASTTSDPTQGQFAIVTATADGVSRTSTLNVNPPPPGPALSALALNPTAVTGGGTSTGTVTVGGTVSACCVIVTLSSSDSAAATVPASVAVPVGSSSVQFPVTTASVATSTAVTITATRGGITRTAVLTVNPAGAASLSSVSLAPTSVTGGSSYAGTVTLTGAAPAGGVVVSLTSSNPGVASAPAPVTVAAGTTSAGFTATTNSVSASTSVTVTATSGLVIRTATLTVNPPGGVSLSSLSLSPTSVTGGSSSTGTVTLTSAAPSGGVIVTLSDNSAAATVPADVTVAAGATSATFIATTITVTALTAVTITATSGGVSRTATLTVNPASSGTPVAPSLVSPANDARFDAGQTITFDWSDVTGAASYMIQIDDQDTFPSPLVNQTVTPSTYQTSTLPVTRMWFRVRANDASGTPGAWSAVRRFEIR